MKELFIACATSADMLAAAAVLRAAGIKLPLFSVLAACLGGSLILWGAACAASLITGCIPVSFAVCISRLILIIMGVITALSQMKNKRNTSTEEGYFSCCVDILSDPAAADADHSRSISFREAVVMGVALSADSIFTGIGAGTGGARLPELAVYSLLTGIAACFAGNGIGCLISENPRLRCRIPTEIISGLILIAVAIFGF